MINTIDSDNIINNNIPKIDIQETIDKILNEISEILQDNEVTED